MTKLDSILLSSFERWANSYWAEGLDCEFDSEEERFTDNIVNAAWEAYREAIRVILASLVIGAEVSEDGAAVVLMSKVEDITLVLKSGFVLRDKPVVGRVA